MYPIIAIDGYVATGKGTTAKLLAQRLGRMYIDTGAMYRAATYVALRDGWIDVDDEVKASTIKNYNFHFEINQISGNYDMRVDDENVESHIRSTALGLSMKPIVTCRLLRAVLQDIQRSYANYNPLVADGRDMGTVVFPNARWKFFLICDLTIRIERRYKQLVDAGKDVEKSLIAQEIQQRDWIDYVGPDAVNKMADDAIVMDTSFLTIDEQVTMILSYITAQ